mmetsp:Transcript_91186/g.162379  ORF Transcript_91186/g.162379 Transcript_91186/m.162379 type:complete len:201 (-) Transcript_91186:322-924(-)
MLRKKRKRNLRRRTESQVRRKQALAREQRKLEVKRTIVQLHCAAASDFTVRSRKIEELGTVASGIRTGIELEIVTSEMLPKRMIEIGEEAERMIEIETEAETATENERMTETREESGPERIGMTVEIGTAEGVMMMMLQIAVDVTGVKKTMNEMIAMDEIATGRAVEMQTEVARTTETVEIAIASTGLVPGVITEGEVAA